MLNDARVASLGFFKDNICTSKSIKKKSLKSSSRSPENSPKFCRTTSTMVHDRVLALLTTNEEHAKMGSQTETNVQMDGTDGDSGGLSNNGFEFKRGKLS